MSTNLQIKKSSGNALSDQPEAVRVEFREQLDAVFGSSVQVRPRSIDFTAWGSYVPFLLEALVNALRLGLRRDTAESGTRGDMKKPYILGPGAIEYFPTWSFWGRTKVHLHNTGSVPTTILVNDDRIQLEPNQETDKEGQWAAYPVRVVNSNESVGSEITVVVT